MKFSPMKALLAAFVASATVVACGEQKRPSPSQPAFEPASAQSARVTPIGQLPQIDVSTVLASAKTLASDQFEGRAPGSKGEDLTVAYLVEQFRALGLRPGNADGTYIQKVPLVGITPDPAALVVKKSGQELSFKYTDEVIGWTKRVTEKAAIESSELVFVGYGVVAPEFEWDDYKDVDVKGKTLVMLVNDPPVPDPANPEALDPGVFGGRAMTYYGRWTYKFEMAAQKGAAGAFIIHETGPAGYPFAVLQGTVGERFDLVTTDKNMGRAAVEGWVTLEAGQSLLKLAGQDFDALKAQAATREFRPVPLGVAASMTLHNKLRTISSRNVIAKIDGRDPKLKDECVIYTAHWDHMGVGPEVNGDRIYNGAVDNALGVAGLIGIAQAFRKLPAPPKRSIFFLLVTAEEQGLLGSEYYARHPIRPLAKTLAAINVDELNPHGRTIDLPIVGFGQSELDDYVVFAAGEQGRIVKPDAEPEKGYYYRSDHFNFAKMGVPALSPDAPRETEFIGKPPEYGPAIVQEFSEHTYHQPSDEVRADWDLSGAREDLQLFFAVGERVAEAEQFPAWKAGSEFKARRDAMLKK